ncbi:hypothetical protein D0B54_22110 [Solimonas sp. K1W22B-7]|nr:hypothetical protein D0B54_22110 [Solimonas sp. K1W22B-7]
MAQFWAQPGGPGPFLRHAALLVARVRRVHHAPRALPGAKMISGAAIKVHTNRPLTPGMG